MGRTSALEKLTGAAAPAATPAAAPAAAAAPKPAPSGAATAPAKTPAPTADPKTPPPATPAATPAPTDDDARFAAIAKREAAIQTERAKLKEEKEAVERLRKEVQEKLTPYEEAQVLKAKDPIAAMRKMGFSETDIFNFLAEKEASEPKTPEEKAAAAAAKAAQDVIDKARKEDTDRAAKAQEERNEALRGRLRADIGTALKANAEKFPHAAHKGALAEASAYETVVNVLKETGELISVEEAIEMVDEFERNEHATMQGLIEKRKAAAPAPAEGEAPPAEPAAAAKPKTVTNAATATLASTVNRPETKAEKRLRLEQALREGRKP